MTNGRVRFDEADHAAVGEALNRQDLWPYSPRDHSPWQTARELLESHYGVSRAVTSSSGSASIHIALGGLQIPAGSEVIVAPISDIGTVMPIIFQNAIPVFADVDIDTGLVTAKTINEKITERTSAVIVVHLTGSPCDMDPIIKLCRSKKLKLIEDAAQALGATYRGKPMGIWGDAGCFSLNSQKHITCGEGGFVLVHSEDDYERCMLFSDKHRKRTTTASTNEEFKSYAGSGVNYRLSALELSLIPTQFPKLQAVAQRMTTLGQHLDQRLSQLPGIFPQKHHPEAVPTYFFNMFRLEGAALVKRKKIQAAMTAAAASGMTAGFGYGADPLYRTRVFLTHNFFDTIDQPDNAKPVWPAELVARHHYPDLPADQYDYGKIHLCNAERWIDEALSLSFHDGHSTDDLDRVVEAIEQALNT